MPKLRMIGATIGALILASTIAAAVASPAQATAAEDCETVTVTGRESADSGENGNNWATTTLDRSLKVCTAGGEGGTWTYVATVTDSGEFVTKAGESPGIALATLTGGVRGTVNGGFKATFTAPADWDGKLVTPPATTTTGQWVATAFPGAVFTAAGSVAEWRWVYNLCGENGEWWVNAEAGNSGDITEKACPVEPTATPTKEPTSQPTVEPTTGPTTAPTTGPTIPAPGAGGGLPVTGSPAAVLGGVGLAAVLLGAGALVLLRRRRVTFDA